MHNEKESTLKTVFRALRYRNFRLFFFGQSISLVGTWMQMIAMGWLVYRMTNSPFLLGIVGFASQIPMLILGPFAGVIVDRYDRHKILLITQVLSMAQALILAALTITGNVAVWHVVTLGAILGCVNALDIPARQSFIVEMVERKENLANAIALNSFMFNSARLVGPSVAGIVISFVGEGMCFLFNGLSFITVIISLLAMRLKKRPNVTGDSEIMKKMKEGFLYSFNCVPIRLILLLLGVTSLMGMSYVVLMPVFARDVLHGNSSTLGFLMAAGGIGALISTIYLASRKSILGLGRMIPISSAIFAMSLVVFSLSHTLWISIIILIFTGFGLMTHMAASNIIMQTIVDDDKRGRVMSLYAVAFMGTAPFGSLIAGYLASSIGASLTLMIGGSFCMFASIYFASQLSLLSKIIHPIYRKIGIIPEVASGIGAATRLSAQSEE